MTEARLVDINKIKAKAVVVERLDGNGIPYETLAVTVDALDVTPAAEAKPVIHAKWQKQWCDSSMIGHMYEECPICGCMILDTEKFWDCKFCPNCGAEMLGDGL